MNDELDPVEQGSPNLTPEGEESLRRHVESLHHDDDLRNIDCDALIARIDELEELKEIAPR